MFGAHALRGMLNSVVEPPSRLVFVGYSTRMQELVTCVPWASEDKLWDARTI